MCSEQSMSTCRFLLCCIAPGPLRGKLNDMPLNAGLPETNFNDRAFSMRVYAPSRTVGIYAKMPEQSTKA